VPVDTKVTKYSVFTTTSPNGMAATLILSIGGVPFNCSVTVFETLPALASNITVCVEPTDDTVAVNPALVAFAGTVTVAGAQTAPLRARRCSAGKPSLPRGCVASCEFETLLGTNKTLTCPSTF
jgi:hypothetical protein